MILDWMETDIEMRMGWGGQAMEGKDGFGGVGATIVDSLDTLWLMGLKDEFAAAQNWTANELTFDRFAHWLAQSLRNLHQAACT